MNITMKAALELGRRYAQAGRPLSDCPFDPNVSPEEKAKALRFAQGYVDARPSLIVDYGD